MEDVLVPLIFFTFMGIVVIVPQVLDDRARREGLQVLKELVSRGVPLDAAVLDRLDLEPRADAETVLRRILAAGIFLTMLALGVLGAHLVKPSPGLLMASPVLGSLGIAFLILAYVLRRMRGTGSDR